MFRIFLEKNAKDINISKNTIIGFNHSIYGNSLNTGCIINKNTISKPFNHCIFIENTINKITITNNKGRLSKDEIENLIKEAERYKEQDQKIRKRVEAKNGLESYCVSIKHTLDDEKVQDKFENGEKDTVKAKVTETESWLSSNPEADTSEYEAKQK